MATILVVDDRAINREFLAALFSYVGYEVEEAPDGARALAAATERRPALIITDVLMPVMDGVELTHRLRADPRTADVPIIFYTATYRLSEAQRLATACGVAEVIAKPSKPQTLLDAVEKLIGPGERLSGLEQETPALGHELASHLPALSRLPEQLQMAQESGLALLRNGEGLERSLASAHALSLQLAALVELGIELASERDAARLLDMFARAAQNLMNVSVTAVGLLDQDGQTVRVASRGLPPATHAALSVAHTPSGILARTLFGRQPLRLELGEQAAPLGLPPGHPHVRNLLALPVHTSIRAYGWAYFADKKDDSGFGDEDEQLATTMASQLATCCENLALLEAASRHARELEAEAAERRESELRFRQIAENIREVFLLADPWMSQIFYVSPTYEEIWGLSRDSLYADSSSWKASIHPDDRHLMQRAMGGVRNTGNMDAEFRVLRPDGSMRWVWGRTFPILDDKGRLVRVAGLAEDITQRKEQEQRIDRLNRIYAVLSGINSIIVRVHERAALLHAACRVAVADGRFAYAWIGLNEGSRLLPVAWEAQDPGARPPHSVALGGDAGGAEAEAAVGGTTQVCNDLRVCRPVDRGLPDDPVALGFGSRIALPLRQEGKPAGALMLYAAEPAFFDAEELRLLDELAADVSLALQYIAKEERLQFMVFYDPLTNLPNRRLFLDRAAQLLHGSAHEGERVDVILIDIDHFKHINDGFGRHIGDMLLQRVAGRLGAALEEPYTLARVGPDSFAVAVGGLPAGTDAVSILKQRVLEPLRPPFATSAGEVRLSVHAGIALFPGDGDEAETLLAHAEAALRQALESGEQHVYYAPEINARITAKLALEEELRQATQKHEFTVYYQPKVSLQSGAIVGAEALLRWLHPERGIVSPLNFIALAEESGLIVPISEWVLQTVCGQLAEWQDKELEAPPISVNLSAVLFKRGGVLEVIKHNLEAARLQPAQLDVELTETVVMEDPEEASLTLQALRDLGVNLSLDDFGTGYSSLAYLKRFPFDTVKIDRAFVTDITSNPGDAAIANAIVAMARRLGLSVVAEGVETTGQLNYLRNQGCDQMQGYLFSLPLPPAEFEELIRSSRRLPLPEKRAQKRTLLLVDDEAQERFELTRLLRRDGYQVLTAASSEEAFEMLADHSVQVVISDQQIDGMSGSDFLSVVKELYPDTIRIILSAYAELRMVIEAVNRGAVFKFLTKPWDDRQLREHVRDAFRRYRPSAQGLH